MRVLETAQQVREWVKQLHAVHGLTIGFVPTMGSLHEAHLSLIDISRQRTDKTIVSIFVNPAQFSPGEDFDSYPRDEEADLELCRERGVDAVWLPSVDEMYPEGFSTYVEVEGLDTQLCGASRPGHFRGVTTVVSKLFNVVQPDVAVFGRKDVQQARIIQRMTYDLQFGIEIILGDTLREVDGLAMSSRNVRLTPEHRLEAPALHQALSEASSQFQEGINEAERLLETVRNRIKQDAPSGKIDYIQLVGWNDLQPVEHVDTKSLLAVAVRFGSVRLIDNIILEK
ncbi:MAG TPA: pantoate--beta-alanine ligase [Bacteroidetes bacterium]|nr:pantothenate synthetase [bacterium BMS3Bbin04]HDO64921.1 pantoate--beta-alanine ligase [Bacteroidota bacterium]HEX04046.1 pantoate--beta-alanine ligase [Bacteroidota bacterium]